MSGFSADWLALREPADIRARDVSLGAQLVRRARLHSPARFVDLACGTGSNVRYLAPRVGGDQQWLLVDNDSSLLERAASLQHVALLEGATSFRSAVLPATAALMPGCRVETRCLDLANELHTLDFAPGSIVTASALLDLVSDRWLAQIVERCRASRCAALFALSYDGRMVLTPSDPDDEWVRQLVNRHQLGDKGFGPALGPAAARRCGELFREAGYEVHAAPSDWDLLPPERDLQRALLEGWAAAATELAPSEAARCNGWLARRLAHVASGTSRIAVGHEDVLALTRG